MVALLVIAAGLAAILALTGVLLDRSRSGDREVPLYWALLLPFAWWAVSLASYTPWATRTLRPAAALAALIALASLVIVSRTTSDTTPWLIAAAIAVITAAIGALLYPASLLARRQ